MALIVMTLFVTIKFILSTFYYINHVGTKDKITMDTVDTKINEAFENFTPVLSPEVKPYLTTKMRDFTSEVNMEVALSSVSVKSVVEINQMRDQFKSSFLK